MNSKNLYSEMLLVLDTCEAMSLFDQVEAPNILMVGSSAHEEHAVADTTDGEINVFMTDKFTENFLEFLNSAEMSTNVRISDFTRLFTYDKIKSHVEFKNTFTDKKTYRYTTV
mmetsp:Transcript_33236/g.23973  ORF Transcript_33236/g.23973 Transcript_33236/m.23973 type:complete len:113 (+) Transcript_33236:519-857(+)